MKPLGCEVQVGIDLLGSANLATIWREAIVLLIVRYLIDAFDSTENRSAAYEAKQTAAKNNCPGLGTQAVR